MATLRNLLARAFRKATFLLQPRAYHVDVSDDYLKWLSFANAGMLDKGNLFLIDTAMKRLPSAAPILEIGSFCGLSANAITHFKRRHGIHNTLITCDRGIF